MVALAHKTDGLRESIPRKRNEQTHTAAKAEGRYTPVLGASGAQTGHSFQKAHKRQPQARQHMSTVARADQEGSQRLPQNAMAARL
jgi:hypothetical protein